MLALSPWWEGGYWCPRWRYKSVQRADASLCQINRGNAHSLICDKVPHAQRAEYWAACASRMREGDDDS